MVIPKALREDLELGPGDILDLECEGDQIILRPVRSRPPLEKEQGIWVYRTGERLTAAEARDALHRVRDKRSRRGMGKAQ
jgi:AbrB family looped-hinge helix DNA binding protein